MNAPIINEWVQDISEYQTEEAQPEFRFNSRESQFQDCSKSYNPYDITSGQMYIITGMTNTCKTTLGKQILYQNARKFNRVFWWSPISILQNMKFLPKRAFST